MKKWYRTAGLLIVQAMGHQSLLAQQAVAPPVTAVLFVCEHGTVKSLLAKMLFERYAAEVGLLAVAVSRGTQADSAVPAWMQQRLSSDHISLGDWRPQTLRQSDVASASYIVSFDVPAITPAGGRSPSVQWDSLPSVSKDYANGRNAIERRVRALVDSLKRAEVRRTNRAPATERASPVSKKPV